MKKLFKLVTFVFVLVTIIVSVSSTSYSYYDDEYPEIYDTYWNNKTAIWSVDGRAHKYEVRLYRDGRRVFTKTQTGRSHNFSSEMTRGTHEYYFEVRPYNNITGWGNWVESESIYINSREYNPQPYYPTPYNPTPYSPGVPSSGPGESVNTPSSQIVSNPVGQWVVANNYWHFQYTNGTFAVNSWLEIGGKWYYIDLNTNMAVGLVNLNSGTYYFNPDGTMVTGTIILNGITHYFDSNGKMVY